MEWYRRKMIPSSSVGAVPGNASSGQHEGWSIWEQCSYRNTKVCAPVTGNCPRGFPRASCQTISLLLWQVEEPERKYKRQVEHAKLIHSKCTISNTLLLQSTLILEAGKHFQNALRITTVISLTHDPVTWYKITHAVTQKHSGTSKTKAGKVDWYDLLGFGSPTVQLAPQHVWFCTMWPYYVQAAPIWPRSSVDGAMMI